MRKQGYTARAKAWLAAVLALMCSVIVVACGGTAAGGQPTGAAFNPPETLIVPVVSSDGPTINVDHVSDGYVVARCNSAAKVKFQTSCGNEVYNYDLPNDGTPSVFPLNMGNGTYTFRIMSNVGDENYVESERVEADVKLSSEFAPYIIPNQYCNYNEQSACVAKARELTADATNQGEAVRSICGYIIDNVTYDTAKAKKLTTVTGYIPDPDETLSTNTGICFDYASLGAAMLRSVGFPTKVITGYVSPGDLYHAWIMVYVDGSWKTGEFSVTPDTWSRVDLTFAASGSTEFTGDGTSYSQRFVY